MISRAYSDSMCLQWYHVFTVISRIYSDITCLQWYHEFTVIACVYNDITCLQWYHVLTVISRVYSDITSLQWYHVFTVISRVYSDITSLQWYHEFTVITRACTVTNQFKSRNVVRECDDPLSSFQFKVNALTTTLVITVLKRNVTTFFTSFQSYRHSQSFIGSGMYSFWYQTDNHLHWVCLKYHLNVYYHKSQLITLIPIRVLAYY